MNSLNIETSIGVEPLPWHRALRERIAIKWFWKMIGTAFWITAFFMVYFWVMHDKASQAIVMPLLWLDHWIEPRESALLLYGSLWFLVSLPVSFAREWAELFPYAAAAALMTIVGLAFYWFMPTAVPAFAIEWSRYPALQFLKSSDLAGNAFPSMHVSFSVLACAALVRQLRTVSAPRWTYVLTVAWCMGVIYSTIATRQHVVLDVVGGLVFGWVVCWVMGRITWTSLSRKNAGHIA